MRRAERAALLRGGTRARGCGWVVGASNRALSTRSPPRRATGHTRAVISNVMKGGSLLELGGMDGDGLVAGTPVWRPLLPLHKDAIFAFAHKYGEWSRNRIRGRLSIDQH